MFPEERKKAILALLTETGRVEVTSLATRFEVSEDTIRRDLREFAAAGFLQKTYGGAVALDVANLSWAARAQIAPAAKARIGVAAASLVEPGQTVILDAGLTTLEIAKQLRERPLRVITNSLDIANVLSESSRVQLILTGGEWMPGDRYFAGDQAQKALAAYRADWAFFGAYGVHPRAGMTASDSYDAATKRAIVGSALRTVLVADKSKFGRLGTHAVGPLGSLEALITDEAPSWLAHAGIRVIVAAP
jgi:DeoR/GlpR family transcriptional regulator of sugar metabolism